MFFLQSTKYACYARRIAEHVGEASRVTPFRSQRLFCYLAVLVVQMGVYLSSRWVCTCHSDRCVLVVQVGVFLSSTWVCTCHPDGCVLVIRMGVYLLSRWVCTCCPGGCVLVVQVGVYLLSRWVCTCCPGGYTLVVQVGAYLLSRWVCTYCPGGCVLVVQVGVYLLSRWVLLAFCLHGYITCFHGLLRIGVVYASSSLGRSLFTTGRVYAMSGCGLFGMTDHLHWSPIRRI